MHLRKGIFCSCVCVNLITVTLKWLCVLERECECICVNLCLAVRMYSIKILSGCICGAVYGVCGSVYTQELRGLCVSVCFFSFEGCSSMPWKGKQWRTPPQFYTEAWGAWRSPDALKTGSRVVTGSRRSREWTQARAFWLCHFLLCDLESVSWPLWSLLLHLPEEHDPCSPYEAEGGDRGKSWVWSW